MPVVVIVLGVLVAYGLWSSGQEAPGTATVKLPAKPLGPLFKKGDRVIIIGLPMSGKTHLAAELTKDCPRVGYFDPYHDYRGMAGAVEVSANELIANPDKYLHRSEFRYAIIPDEDELSDQFDDVVRILRAAGNCIIVCDEVGDYKRESTLTLEKLARNGRHDGVVPLYVSQVAMDIPRTVRRLATQVYSFRQEDIDDLDALAERYGEKYAEQVKNLPLHRYALWTIQGFGPPGKSGASQSPSLPKHSGASSSTKSAGDSVR